MRILAALVLAGAILPASAQVFSGRRAPSFSLPDSALVQHDILDYRGKWLLLDFMKTDCPHCMVLSKLLEQIKTQFGGKVEVLSVLIAPPETTSTAARYAMDAKVTSPFVFDQGQVAAAYFKATPSRPGFDTPHLFVINPAGTIVRDWGDNDGTREIMEGPGLARELGSLMAGTAKTAPAPAK
jgi:peroxiredoxin